MPKARLTVVKDSENASLYTITFDDNQGSVTVEETQLQNIDKVFEYGNE